MSRPRFIARQRAPRAHPRAASLARAIVCTIALGTAFATAFGTAFGTAFAAAFAAASAAHATGPASGPAAEKTAASAAAPATFPLLLERLARMPGFEAGFREEKTIALLAEPLESRGRLYFQPPDRLLRRTESPRPSDVLVTRERVVLVDGTTRSVIDLASQEQVRPLVESILWIFAGDREAIERSYAIDYRVGTAANVGGATDGDAASWQLRLRPRTSPLDLLISELRIEGRGGEARRFEVLEASGDRSVTTLLDANPARRFDDEERRRLFDAPAP